MEENREQDAVRDGGAAAPSPEDDAPLAVGEGNPAEGERLGLEAELEETKGRLLRALADAENARRRHEREADEARKFAAVGFARDVLEVADNLRRALASVPDEARAENEVMQSLMTGLEMTERTLLAAFERHRIERIDPVRGEKFDHNRHQAMFEVPTAEMPAGMVAEVMQPGYQMAGRLVRPALVGVSKAAQAKAG
ncbi:MAG: nucleotide exchange factor GrpE [Geminicoccaceae bacterium]|nr:nucleotide exchange factor GrpE [Geminicoccaceae bacterium]